MNLMDSQQWKNMLALEGFPIVYEWHDNPYTIYPLHSHQGKVSFYVVHWSVTFDFNGVEETVVSGERFDVPVNIEHSAIVWPEGCDYIVWQMYEDDA